MRIEQIAAQQLGLFTRVQAASCGLSPSMLARRVAAGSLDRMHDGVFRFAAGAWHPHTITLAALLRAGEGAFAAGSSSLFTQGLLKEPPRLVQLTSPRQLRVPGAQI